MWINSDCITLFRRGLVPLQYMGIRLISSMYVPDQDLQSARHKFHMKVIAAVHWSNDFSTQTFVCNTVPILLFAVYTLGHHLPAASSLLHAVHHSSMLSHIWTCIPCIPNRNFSAIPNKLCLVMSSVIKA